MNEDVKKNDKNRSNALGGTYGIIKKENHDSSKIHDIRQCMYAETLPKKKKRKAAVTQTHVACEQKGFTCEHQDITMSKRGTNDKQKEQIRHELCKYVHTNTTEVLVGGDKREDGFVTPSHTSESVLNKGFHTIWE